MPKTAPALAPRLRDMRSSTPLMAAPARTRQESVAGWCWISRSERQDPEVGGSKQSACVCTWGGKHQNGETWLMLFPPAQGRGWVWCWVGAEGLHVAEHKGF